MCVNCSIVSDSLQPHELPGSSVHGLLQARILEWAAISFIRDLLDPWNDRSPVLASRFFNTWALREALLPIFNWVYCFLNLKFSEFHMYSRYKTYSSYIICRYFLLETYLFILLTVSFAEQEFSFWSVSVCLLIYVNVPVFSLDCAFCVISQNITIIKVMEIFFSCVFLWKF